MPNSFLKKNETYPIFISLCQIDRLGEVNNIPQNILNDIAKGDKSAFDSLFKSCYKPLCYFVFKMVHDQPLSQEIVQELFINLWENPPRTNIEVSVSSYLYRSAYNRALNVIDKIKTRAKHEQNFAEESANSVEDQLADNTQIMSKVNAAIEELPEKCKEIFILCKQQECTYSQVAQILQISERTVENQMGIAMKKLREKLSSDNHLKIIS